MYFYFHDGRPLHAIFEGNNDVTMNIEEIMLQSEALIFGSDKPISSADIELLLKESMSEDEVFDKEKLQSALEAIVEKYSSDFYPFEVKQIGGGFQFLSKTNYYPTLAKLNGEKYTKRLSTASMETLAIIAYKQPITKGEIEHIRGVSSDYSVQKLLEKELIVISGRMEEMVGKPLTYSTSKSFMNYLGINSIDELPKLHEILQQDMVEPTDANEASPDYVPEQVTMVVSEHGDLLEVPTGNQNQPTAE